MASYVVPPSWIFFESKLLVRWLFLSAPPPLDPSRAFPPLAFPPSPVPLSSPRTRSCGTCGMV